jgi:CRP-like cAMP-binding protein
MSTMPRHRSFKVSPPPRLQELKTKYTAQVFDKTQEDEAIIWAELARNFIFQKVDNEPLEQMVKAFEPIDKYKQGYIIIQQYGIGDSFYIIGKGSFVYEVNGLEMGGADQVGTAFGELALLYQTLCKATVRANSDEMWLYRVDHMAFRYILQSRSKFKSRRRTAC